MKFTYQWLQEYCPCDLAPEKLVHLLTMSGVKVEEYHSLGDDTCFLAEITANRPDCLSVIGIARETAVLTRKKLRIPVVKPAPRPKKSGWVDLIKIETPELCPIYIGRVIKGVKVGPSPDWLKQRLEAIGLRSINNVVDITNYVMLESGQPLHAFDLDKLAEHRIVVRLARAGEKIMAIDEKEYKLSPEMLVIADAREPVAIAGVMGGKGSEVTESTRNILLESAFFQPTSIRKTSRRLVLLSDSSYRFERGVNPIGVEWGSHRAATLIKELTHGELTHHQEINRLRIKERKIILRVERACETIGVWIDKQEIKRILKGLGFVPVREWKGQIEFKVPVFRNDINLEIDLVEEIARIYGYDHIPTVPPLVNLKVQKKNKIDQVNEAVRYTLTGLGYFEAMTSSFAEERYHYDFPFWSKEKVIGLLDPEGKEDRFLRNNLASALLLVNKTNEGYASAQSEREARIRLFEIAKVYYRVGDKIKERFSLGLLDNHGFYALKGVLTRLWGRLNLLDRVRFVPEIMPFFAAGHATRIMLGDKEIGYLGELIPTQGVGEKYDIRKKIAIAEIDFESLVETADLKRQFQDFSRLPGIRRDLAIIVDEKTIWSEIESIIRKNGGEYLKAIEFFDQYRGKQVPAGKKSLAFSLLFQTRERTLTHPEIDAMVQKAVESLKTSFQAELRA